MRTGRWARQRVKNARRLDQEGKETSYGTFVRSCLSGTSPGHRFPLRVSLYAIALSALTMPLAHASLSPTLHKERVTMNKYAITITAALLAFGSLAAQEAPRSRKSMPTPTLRRAVRDVKPLKKQEKIEEKKDSNQSNATGDRWQDHFSREPMWFIQCHIGQSNDPLGRGRAPWWYASDGVDWLVNEIRTAYRFGARRFLINRPMGTLPPGVPMPAASWLTMEPERRSEITTKINDLLLDECPDAELYWYIGSDLTDPRVFDGGLRGRDPGFFGLGDSSTPKRQIATRSTLGGWLSTGAAGVGMDYTGQPAKRGEAIALFNAMRGEPFNFAIIGESIPLVGGRPDGGVDRDTIDLMPWLATVTDVDARFDDSVVFDREDTRVFIWFAGVGRSYGGPRERIERVYRYMDRGMIAITCDKEMFLAALNRARQTGEVNR